MTSVISEKYFNWINEYFSALLDTIYYMRITTAREYQQLDDKSTDFSTYFKKKCVKLLVPEIFKEFYQSNEEKLLDYTSSMEASLDTWEISAEQAIEEFARGASDLEVDDASCEEQLGSNSILVCRHFVEKRVKELVKLLPHLPERSCFTYYVWIKEVKLRLTYIDGWSLSLELIHWENNRLDTEFYIEDVIFFLANYDSIEKEVRRIATNLRSLYEIPE